MAFVPSNKYTLLFTWIARKPKKTRFQGMLHAPESRSPSPGPRVPIPESRILESRFPSPGFHVPVSESQFPSTGSRNPVPESRFPNPDSYSLFRKPFIALLIINMYTFKSKSLFFHKYLYITSQELKWTTLVRLGERKITHFSSMRSEIVHCVLRAGNKKLRTSVNFKPDAKRGLKMFTSSEFLYRPWHTQCFSSHLWGKRRINKNKLLYNIEILLKNQTGGGHGHR